MFAQPYHHHHTKILKKLKQINKINLLSNRITLTFASKFNHKTRRQLDNSASRKWQSIKLLTHVVTQKQLNSSANTLTVKKDSHIYQPLTARSAIAESRLKQLRQSQ